MCIESGISHYFAKPCWRTARKRVGIFPTMGYNIFRRTGIRSSELVQHRTDTLCFCPLNSRGDMTRKNEILLTLSQIVLGAVVGLVGGGLCLFIFEKFFWEVIIAGRVQHGFWVGLLLLISFGVTYGATVVGVAESVRFAGRKFGVDIGRRGTYEGAFLGAPAIVALMSLLNIQWAELVPQNLLISLLLPVFRAIAFLISLPLRVLLLLRCPPELLYILAAPIGAILGYRLRWSTKKETESLAVDH